jgi:endo-1,4-beta-D-glucanase Y
LVGALRNYKLKAILLSIGLACSSALGAAHAEALQFEIPKYPSNFKQLLSESWQKFKAEFIDADGRVKETTVKTVTSESASYALLMAVFEDDRPTFDLIWAWIEANLSNRDLPEYGPFTWSIEYADDGRTISNTKHESATDADQDIAFALILASYKWNNDTYRESALSILNRLWERNTVEVLGKRYLTGGDWASKLENPRLNPSYFAPYEYRVFSVVDSAHPWMTLVDTSYEVLAQTQPRSRLGLPPDWCDINRKTGAIIANPFSADTAFSYDAIRVPWRLAFDAQLFGEQRALIQIQTMSFLLDSWKQTRAIKGGYSQTGVVTKPEEPLVALSCAMPAISMLDGNAAAEILREKLMARYQDGIFRPAEIYNNAWAWFSIAATAGLLQLPDKLQTQLRSKH